MPIISDKTADDKADEAKEKVEPKKEEKKVEAKPVTPKTDKKVSDSVTPEVASTLGKLGLEHPLEKKEKPTIMRSPSEYFPLIRRGFLGDSTDEKPEDEEELAVGWKVDFANRKEREESLRYVISCLTYCQ